MTDAPVPLIRRYRPQEFAEVLGQDDAVASLRQALKKKTAQTFVLTGPSGTGKTTLARIVARHVGCDPRDVLEFDAATNTGIDAMRDVTERLAYRGLFGKGIRVVIVDEAHALSAAAWKSVLKSTEEPSRFTYWVFCTTEPERLPVTLMTRAFPCTLVPVESDVLFTLLEKVRDKEHFRTTDKVLDFISRRAQGSPRLALTLLAVCADVTKVSRAAKLLRETLEKDKPVFALCQALAKGCDWATAMRVLEAMGDVSPESVRIQIADYFTKAARGAKSDARAGRAVEILSAVETPYPPQSGMGSLVVSLAHIILQE